MFVSHDNSNKKTLQKPNILRRNPKTFKSINKVIDLSREKVSDPCYLPEIDLKEIGDGSKKVHNMNNSCDLSDANSNDHNMKQIELKQACTFPMHSDADIVVQSSLNIDSFFIRNSRGQNTSKIKSKHNFDSSYNQKSDKFCFSVIDDSNPLIVGNYKTNISGIVPHTIFSEKSETSLSKNELDTHNFSIEDLSQTRIRYKCDEADCEKIFLSEKKLLKHKKTHSKVCRVVRQTVFECPVKNSCNAEENCQKVFLVKAELVKHINEDHSADDAAYKCDECERRFFWATGLRAHKRSHVTRASFTCPWPECGRVFRHACRLREHSRAHTGAKPYHCTYPNCGWSFRTASKLLRHSRRHTGDRRHSCSHCGRAFLRREHLREHEARHYNTESTPNEAMADETGKTPSKPARKSDMSRKKVKRKEYYANEPYTDQYENELDRHDSKKSGQKFMMELWEENTEMKSLDEKCVDLVELPTMESVDDLNAEVIETVTGLVVKPEQENFVLASSGKESVSNEDLVITKLGPDGKFVVTRAGEGDFVIAPQGGEDEISHFDEERDFGISGHDEDLISGHADNYMKDGRAARTHCTWPLHKAEYNSPEDYVLEDDVQVENLEGSESNVFTVRSDLFLHGSVFHNEDSEQMCSAVRASGSERALDTELMLDAPSVHLAQEELYTDVVDESSFRVFLLSGEELA